MIALGYMLKSVVRAPDWMASPKVDRVCSVSGCVSPVFADFIPRWCHNGWWMFDSVAALLELAAAEGVDTSALTLFYYEAFEDEFDETSGSWSPIAPSWPGRTVDPPRATVLHGYDVVTYSARTSPECSPLSCNGLARELEVNELCLLRDLATARRHLEQGAFKDTERGPFRILSVHTVDPIARSGSNI